MTLVGSYWSFYGANTFGITLVPMLLGAGILFWNGRSLAGWIVTAAGALFILAGVIANMSIYFGPTSLFNTLVMLIMLVGGPGLVARALRPHPAATSASTNPPISPGLERARKQIIGRVFFPVRKWGLAE